MTDDHVLAALKAYHGETKHFTHRDIRAMRVALEAAELAQSARIADLKYILKECADDLAAEIYERYRLPNGDVHPAMQVKYDIAIAPVRAARAALGEKE